MQRHSATAPSILLLVWITFTIFGSWYPFTLRSQDIWNSLVLWLNSIHQYKPKTDILVNIMLGVPTGVLSYASITHLLNLKSHSRFTTFLHVLVSTLVCLLIACFVELGQFFFDGRDPSLWDSICQIFGSVLGFTAVIFGYFKLDRSIEFLENFFRHLDPIDKTLGPLVVAFLIYQLWPFIPTLSPSELKQKLNVFLLGIDSGSLRKTLSRLQIESFQQSLIIFSSSAISGFTVGRIGKRVYRISWLSCCTISCALAPSLEIAKFLIEDRMPTIYAVLICLIGSIFGAFAFYLTMDKEITSV